MPIRVGLYGGSFNPVHHGHLIIARAVAEELNLLRVVFLPSRQPPHKADRALLDANHRAEMVKLAIESEMKFEFSALDLIRPLPCYTYDTVMRYKREFGDGIELCWIIGADSLVELPTWHRAAELVDACRIVSVHRPGWDVIDWTLLGRSFDEAQIARLRENLVAAPRIEISSTMIRERIRDRRSITYLVPDAVREYIEDNKLYRD